MNIQIPFGDDLEQSVIKIKKMKTRKHELQFSQHKRTFLFYSLTVNYAPEFILKKATESGKYQVF